jgi:hypothetical protein
VCVCVLESLATTLFRSDYPHEIGGLRLSATLFYDLVLVLGNIVFKMLVHTRCDPLLLSQNPSQKQVVS